MTRKNIFKILVSLLTLLVSASCTQNNGRIGELFGTWVLTSEVDIEGSPLPDNVEAYMSFQGDIVRFMTVADDYSVLDESYAKWTRSGNVLTFDFDNSDNTSSFMYGVPVWLAPRERKMVLTIVKLDGGKLKLVRQADSTDLIYNFSKTW